MQCQAKNKATKEQCRRRAITGKTVCYVHGGASRGSVASATYKHGRYSKYLPARLSGRYQEAQADTELLALREEISLIDSRLSDLLQRVDTNEAGHWWKELNRVYDDFRVATAKADTEAARHCLNEWGRIVQLGSSDYAAWDEVYNTIEQRRKLVESERKRLVEMSQVLTVERVMLLISALTDVIKSHVTDHGILSAISADIGKLISIEPS